MHAHRRSGPGAGFRTFAQDLVPRTCITNRGYRWLASGVADDEYDDRFELAFHADLVSTMQQTAICDSGDPLVTLCTANLHADRERLNAMFDVFIRQATGW